MTALPVFALSTVTDIQQTQPPILTLTSLAEQALVNTQVLSSTVLLKHFDLISHVAQVVGEMHRFTKVHHVHRHSALVHRAPQHWGVLYGGKKKSSRGQFDINLIQFRK